MQSEKIWRAQKREKKYCEKSGVAKLKGSGASCMQMLSPVRLPVEGAAEEQGWVATGFHALGSPRRAAGGCEGHGGTGDPLRRAQGPKVFCCSGGTTWPKRGLWLYPGASRRAAPRSAGCAEGPCCTQLCRRFVWQRNLSSAKPLSRYSYVVKQAEIMKYFMERAITHPIYYVPTFLWLNYDCEITLCPYIILCLMYRVHLFGLGW